MKLLSVLVMLTVLSTPSFAWEKIISCDNGNLVIDIGENDGQGRPTYQLVLRGEPLQHFIQTGGVRSGTVRNGEFITEVMTYDSSFFGTQVNWSYSNPYLTQWISIAPDASFVSVTAYEAKQSGRRDNNLADWKFYNCWKK